MTPRLVHSPGYDLTLYGLERLHPFDGRKYSRARRRIMEALGAGAADLWEEPAAPVSDDDLRLVHTQDYLDTLATSPPAIATALEMPFLRFLPHKVLQSRLLTPMRLAVQGTIQAMGHALDGATAMNIGGGYHHAFPDHGEGFCLYADIPVALAHHREAGAINPDEPVLLIDLDAHRGNGFFAAFEADPAVHILDLYNAQRYPGLFDGDEDKHPYQVPMRAGLTDAQYKAALDRELPEFLESVATPRLAIYNAGTDIIAGDRLGGLDVSYDGVRARDRLVVDTLAERGVPTVIVTSGGYSKDSHRLIADLAIHLVERSPGDGKDI